LDTTLGLSAGEWEAVYRMSARQGVLALAWDAVQRSEAYANAKGSSLSIPRGLRLQWALGAEAVEARFEKQKKAAQELVKLFAPHGIKVLIFKGLALGHYYPVPSRRECGDVDIYLFDGFEAGNDLAAQSGAPVEYETEKHSSFHWAGVPVENHKTLLGSGRVDDIVSRHLEPYLRAEDYAAGELNCLSAEGHLIFCLRHNALHFGTVEGIRLRHIVDWGLFLAAEGSGVNTPRVREAVKEAGLDTFHDLMTVLAADILRIRLDEFLFSRPSAELKERFLSDILSAPAPSPSGKVHLALHKLRHNFSLRWKYSRILPEKFFRERFFPGVLRNLKQRI
jgi:hypothetical protein